ncbi:plastid/chloroplast ribosomal protein L21 [Volvox carteri f. nagariensis]|uniref:Plastid/chloroplast ribosomal protein L21 n=1 Tax=Volvox carteri f. nagariensis TaxID=3068 RepID=D8TS73_VOLCA|nr:plastid/chloroplast ribosomal protein L21 [Volvox carteri f. nagariensis]EFJ49775.1 plastid/chloroplast ribosomal protein L21 [Volvox carteri f. nagariensis]|eukprot:XP_002949282.1 plastid/chloroplast ribosomal protein L21 [Volvox carteri f. nagariensis]
MALANVLSRKAGTATTSRPVPFTSRVCVAAKARVTCAIPSSSRQVQHIVCQAAAAEVAEKPQKVHPSPLSIAPPATYAIVEIGGTQMFVEPGKWYTCNRLKADVGSKIQFGRVLALKHDGKLTVGKPYLSNVNVEAEIIEELRGPKIIVYKMRPKKHYRRKQGHRQELSKFMVTKVEAQ